MITPINSNELTTKYNSDQDLLIIDVRSKEMFDSGHVKGAVNMPVISDEDVATFKLEAEKLDKDANVVLYCGDGKMARKGADILEEKGFSSLYPVTEGFSEFEVETAN